MGGGGEWAFLELTGTLGTVTTEFCRRHYTVVIVMVIFPRGRLTLQYMKHQPRPGQNTGDYVPHCPCDIMVRSPARFHGI